MEPATTIRCVNCGTMLELVSDKGQGTLRCSVCEFPLDMDSSDAEPSISTIHDFESQLGALLMAARSAGIDQEDMIHVLRDELEFAAEMAQPDRHLSVQILDLGPREGVSIHRNALHQRAPLNSRAVGS